MSSAEVEYGVLPARLQSRLEQFSADVAAAAGENLLSVAVYGSVVMCGYCVIGETPVQVLIVLQDASIQFLKPIAGVIRRMIKSFHASPFVVRKRSMKSPCSFLIPSGLWLRMKWNAKFGGASHYQRSWRKHHGARRNPMACESRGCWILRPRSTGGGLR